MAYIHVAERAVQVVKESLKKTKDILAKRLPHLLFSHCITPHSTIRTVPSELHVGGPGKL